MNKTSRARITKSIKRFDIKGFPFLLLGLFLSAWTKIAAERKEKYETHAKVASYQTHLEKRDPRFLEYNRREKEAFIIIKDE
jgi:hypothetical protein